MRKIHGDQEVEGQEGVANEFEQAGETTDVNLNEAPSAEEAAAEAKDTRVWTVDGKDVTKSEFIRHQFTVNNLSRKQITEQFDIQYRTVYGATVNMVNASEPSTRGRSATATKITVTPEGQVVTIVEGVYHLDNVAVEDEVGQAANANAVEVDRNTWIKERVAAGVDRSVVANALGLSYGVVYSLTKEVAGSTQRHEYVVDKEDGSGETETITRSEYIRRLHAGGMSKSEIAKQLAVEYPVVWSALKGTKSEDEKFAEAIEKLAKFSDKVENNEAFAALLEQLRAVTLKVEAPAEETAPASEEVAADTAPAAE